MRGTLQVYEDWQVLTGALQISLPGDSRSARMTRSMVVFGIQAIRCVGRELLRHGMMVSTRQGDLGVPDLRCGVYMYCRKLNCRRRRQRVIARMVKASGGLAADRPWGHENEEIVEDRDRCAYNQD